MNPGVQLAEQVLQQSVKVAQSALDRRLIAVYALGSLAHGGFSPHVSDIDLGLVLHHPLEREDAQAVDAIALGVRGSSGPLAERLSVYWGSLDTLGGNTGDGGRFPLVDVLDLKHYGRLLAGVDVRNEIRSPDPRELIVSSARFALNRLATGAIEQQLRNADTVAAAGTRTLTKLVLFPIRLLFTASTGQVGRNAAAVEYFCAHHGEPLRRLAQSGLAWRDEPPAPGDPEVIHVLQAGLLRLYRIFVSDYENRCLRSSGETELGEAYRKWRERLE